MKPKYKSVVCADGFKMSVQANERAYCQPRNNEGPYHSVEIGYPNAFDFYLHKYAENPDDPTDTVYGYVPTEVVSMCLTAHGGAVTGQLPPMVMPDNSVMTFDQAQPYTETV